MEPFFLAAVYNCSSAISPVQILLPKALLENSRMLPELLLFTGQSLSKKKCHFFFFFIMAMSTSSGTESRVICGGGTIAWHTIRDHSFHDAIVLDLRAELHHRKSSGETDRSFSLSVPPERLSLSADSGLTILKKLSVT